ncbi:MAG: hypothetical protein IKX51_04845 [Bacteroidales bacterium]|nr:hypothetical protein [Bacteroidales bacterium]
MDFTQCRVDGLHFELSFAPCMGACHTRPDDVVHIYAVEFQAEICQLVASVSRTDGCATFDLPDLSNDPDCESSPTFYLYAIVGSCESRAQSQACLRYAEMKQRSRRQAANTACVPTLSADEKRADKAHRNINRHVSPSVFIGVVKLSK